MGETVNKVGNISEISSKYTKQGSNVGNVGKSTKERLEETNPPKNKTKEKE